MSNKNLFSYAREIRKEGEKWQDAIKRAQVILSNSTPQPTPKATEVKKAPKIPAGAGRQPGESPSDYFKRKRGM